MQVAISASCLSIGYGIGTLITRATYPVHTRWRLLTGDRVSQRMWVVLMSAWLLAMLLGATCWISWQNAQRRFMGMPLLVASDAVLVSVVSPLAGALIVIVGRVVARGVAAAERFMRGHVPAVLSALATALLIALLGFVLVRGIALPALAATADSIYAPLNEETAEGVVAPESPAVSGSSASFVAWNTLGRMGRDFVATATSTHDLQMFHGRDAEIAHPVRVYVGVRSADSIAKRADLAVRELERAGGFDRKVLVVWVPTGTGWMIPKAATALEQLYRGDTAIVAIQYSFLPSLLAVFLDAGLENEAGITLFRAVRARWSALPPNRRPMLILFGKSLGAAGAEAPFVGPDAASSLANMVALTDGALIVGAKHSNPIHAQLTRGRDPGSPVWQPVFNRGQSVRFVDRDLPQSPPDAPWLAPRIVYLQHPADPVVFWSIEALWWPPEWMTQPRGFGVPDALRWFPIVSGVQAAGDMIDQLDPPPGFGHDYSTEYANGWASVAPPDGWTRADTERLERFIENLPGEESEL
jgi:uncharacterized membrane protein